MWASLSDQSNPNLVFKKEPNPAQRKTCVPSSLVSSPLLPASAAFHTRDAASSDQGIAAMPPVVPRSDRIVRRTAMVGAATAAYLLLTADYGPSYPNPVRTVLLLSYDCCLLVSLILRVKS